MELTESIALINQQLIDLFSIDIITGKSIWRVVWSEDQFEKRAINTTEAGLLLPFDVVREVPKYRQWVKEKYVLERLVLVPEMNRDELPTQKISYEPIFVFMDKEGNYLPPKIEVCKLVIDTVYAAQGKSSLAKYKDPDANPEAYRARIEETYNELFGEETDVSDALAYGEGVTVPHNYVKES
jgi:hypothetical protein